jgi:hypothetical protein
MEEVLSQTDGRVSPVTTYETLPSERDKLKRLGTELTSLDSYCFGGIALALRDGD